MTLRKGSCRSDQEVDLQFGFQVKLDCRVDRSSVKRRLPEKELKME